MKARIKKLGRRFLDRVPIPYVSMLRRQVKAQGAFAAGDFFSPIPDREEVQSRLKLRRAAGNPPDIDLRRQEQYALLQRYAERCADFPYSATPDPGLRFDLAQTCFASADAILLYCHLKTFEPRRVVEIGTGHSSALILDTTRRANGEPVRLTFIEPFQDNLVRLKQRVNVVDRDRCTIVESKLQDADLAVLSELQSGDLVFAATSHVVKYGNDLQHLFFEILPRLPVGVHVHLHGVHYPFEYPPEWLEDGRYWNEAYFLRAFLAYNESWKIEMFGDYVTREFPEFLAARMPLALASRASSIYLHRVR